jgi:diaminopimelate epimerase
MTAIVPGLRWAKGHGTENDFVLVPDPDGRLHLDAETVRALCDRRAGIGGDGILRVVRENGIWFMDYRNADGSVAEMCGNGIRVYVAYLLHAGLEQLADGETIAIGTRAGTKHVRRVGHLFAADLGSWRIDGGEAAVSAGADHTVHLPGEGVALPGLAVDVGNPHVVVALANLAHLREADLSRAPVLDPEPAAGANVELIVPGPGHLTMRVHERGVGETRSCGTGAVAAVLAARVWGGPGAPDVWAVDVPGGRLQVSVPAGARLSGTSVELVGPATIVAEGRLTG